jgi:hypothetical protein
MADITDVGQALVALIAGAAYPNGNTGPSVGNCPVLVYQGWPNPEQLSSDLPVGKVHISVFPRPGDKKTWVGQGTPQAGTTNSDGSVNYFQEIQRRKRDFQITVWASTHDLRDPVAKAIDSALANINVLPVSDGSSAILRYSTSTQDDSNQKQGVYRRDLFYSVEYSIVLTSVAWPVTKHIVNVNTSAPQANPSPPAIPGSVNLNITNT